MDMGTKFIYACLCRSEKLNMMAASNFINWYVCKSVQTAFSIEFTSPTKASIPGIIKTLTYTFNIILNYRNGRPALDFDIRIKLPSYFGEKNFDFEFNKIISRGSAVRTCRK